MREGALRELRRPLALAAIAVVCLVLQHVLLRVVAHGHVGQVLLAAGSARPPAGAAALAVGLLAARVVSFVLVPGMLLAAAAEAIAYLVVGPPRRLDEDEP